MQQKALKWNGLNIKTKLVISVNTISILKKNFYHLRTTRLKAWEL